MADILPSGQGLEASGEDFLLETLLFPLAPCLAPLACQLARFRDKPLSQMGAATASIP
jgi:hypothetical protein